MKLPMGYLFTSQKAHTDKCTAAHTFLQLSLVSQTVEQQGIGSTQMPGLTSLLGCPPQVSLPFQTAHRSSAGSGLREAL
jgi:hypothetical protein